MIREREDMINAYLSRSANIKIILSQLDIDDKKLLRFLLEKGGWARLNAVTRKFSTMDYGWFLLVRLRTRIDSWASLAAGPCISQSRYC